MYVLDALLTHEACGSYPVWRLCISFLVFSTVGFFKVDDEVCSAADIDRVVDNAVDTFLARYGT